MPVCPEKVTRREKRKKKLEWQLQNFLRFTQTQKRKKKLTDSGKRCRSLSVAKSITAKPFSHEEVNLLCFQILMFWYMLWVVRDVGSRCPSPITTPCRIRNFVKKGTSFLEPSAVSFFNDDREGGRPYDMRGTAKCLWVQE